MRSAHQIRFSSPSRDTGRFRRHLGSSLFALITTLSLGASAATNVQVKHQGSVKKSVEEILEVLASSDICESGCRYHSPDVNREIRLSYKATPNSYYKWKFIEKTQNTKFFSHVKVSKDGAKTRVTIRTLSEPKDAALIKELVQKTQLPHEPIFDKALTTFTLTPQKKGTAVKASAVTTVSGLVTMFTGKVKKGMEDYFAALFVILNR